MGDIRKDLLSSSKALLDLDADGALVPHGIGGLARACLSWGIDEIEHLRADNERLRAALIDIYDAFEELSNADVDQSVKELARGVIQRANRWQESD